MKTYLKNLVPTSRIYFTSHAASLQLIISTSQFVKQEETTTNLSPNIQAHKEHDIPLNNKGN